MARRPASDRMIGERHLLSILGISLPLVMVVLYLVPWIQSSVGFPESPGTSILSFAVTSICALLVILLVAAAHASSFVRQLVNAELRLEPSRREPPPIDPLLEQQGFHHYGSWMLVGDNHVVFAGAGSLLYYSHRELTTVYTDKKQITVASALSDGRSLLTVSLGAIPHRRNLIQGIKKGNLNELLACHRDGLTVLAKTGVFAVEPPGGPLELHLETERREQEWLGAQPSWKALPTLSSLRRRQLVRLADSPPSDHDRVLV